MEPENDLFVNLGGCNSKPSFEKVRFVNLGGCNCSHYLGKCCPNKKFKKIQCQSSVPNGSWNPTAPRPRPDLDSEDLHDPHQTNQTTKAKEWRPPNATWGYLAGSHGNHHPMGPWQWRKRCGHQCSPTTRTPWVLTQCHIDNFPFIKNCPRELIEFIRYMFPKSCGPAMTKTIRLTFI